MKKLTLLPIFLIITLVLEAQTSSSFDASTLSSFSKQDEIKALTSNKMRNVTSFDNRYEGVKGSPFFYDKWVEGKLILNDSALVKNKFLYKFDLAQNELWVKMVNGEERIVFNREILTFELNQPVDKNIKFKKVKLPESPERHHFSISIFESSNISLVKDIKKIFRKADLEDKGLITTGHPYDWFDESTNFYLKKSTQNEYTKVNLKKTDLIEALQLSKAKNESIEKFCKTQNIKGKMTEEEVYQVLNYVELLLNNK